MGVEDLSLLLVRPADLVVGGLRFVGFTADPGGLRATDGSARIELTLPPQATAEAPWAPGARSLARVGGPSRLTFGVAAGLVVPLTAEGLLSALAAGQLLHGAAQAGAEPLSLELPWRMRFAVGPAAPGDPLLADLPVRAQVGAGGATGLWHLRLEAASGLALVPVGADADDPDLVPPLDAGRRALLLAAAGPPHPPATASSVDLSALGGTMSARGSWEGFSWEHSVVLGRDMAVRTESRGLLYPFGHRAVLVKTSQRALLPAGGGPADAGLVEQSWLIVPEPVRGRSTDGALARALPFDEVEVLERVVPLGVPGERTVVSEQRLPKRLDALREERLALEQALQEAESSIEPLAEQARQAIVAHGEAEKSRLLAESAHLAAEIDELSRFKEASDAWDAAHPDRQEEVTEVVTDPFTGEQTTTTSIVTVPGDPNPAPWGQALHDRLQQRLAEMRPFEDAIAQTDVTTSTRLAELVGEDAFLASGGELGAAVARVRQLRVEVPARAALVLAIESTQVDHPVAVWPLGPDGTTPVLLPIRCDGVRLSMPVLFLHDEDQPDTEDWPAFAPLSDPAVLDRIAAAWSATPARDVPLPGLPVDFVRAEVPAPNDVLPVTRLRFGAARDGGGFRAVLDEAEVVLTAVRELVPDARETVTVAYREAYRLQGEATQAVLELTTPLGVDFRAAADRAGGLVAPQFTADVLSRVHGPAPAGALVDLLPEPPDLSTVFGGTTLLGLPLGSLLAPLTQAVPQPLTIRPEPGGGARMSWDDLVLEDFGPLRVTPATRLELTVVRSPTSTTTTCRLDDFALVLPPGSVELVRLDFASLRFTQEQGRPPDLDVAGLQVRIGGDLGLLEALQDAVVLDDVAPRVRTTADGMRVDYALAVPEVSAGMFLLRDIAVLAAVEVPFDGRPIVTTLAFASRDKPFQLGVSVFAGGGYLLFEIDDTGIRTLEASLDFGAAVAINVGIASAEVHALGGVRFVLRGDVVEVSGFLRIGGSVDVLGLVSVSVELRVELTYDPPRLTGRATAVIEIDVTFWSGSIELDSGEYTFVGGRSPQAVPPSSSISVPPPTLPDWQRYRDAFTPS